MAYRRKTTKRKAAPRRKTYAKRKTTYKRKATKRAPAKAQTIRIVLVQEPGQVGKPAAISRPKPQRARFGG